MKFIFLIASICVLFTNIFAAETNSTSVSKEILIHFSQAIEETFQKFECSYNQYTVVLPGFKETDPEAPNCRVNSEGYENVSKIYYKKSGIAFYLMNEDLFDIKSPAIIEKHSDGKVFWTSKPGENGVALCSHSLYLPPLYSDLIVNYERGSSYYSNFNLNDTLQQLLTARGSEVKILPKSDGMLELRIMQPVPKPRFAGLCKLYDFIISTTPSFSIYSYSYGSMYLQGNKEYIFKPEFQVSFSDFRKLSPRMPRIPWRIEYTSFSCKQDPANTLEDRIKLEQSDAIVPIDWGLITVNSFNLNPTFTRGEITFNYPPGTHVYDQFAHRSYIIGDTLEALRKVVEPTNTPTSSALPKSQNSSDHQ